MCKKSLPWGSMDIFWNYTIWQLATLTRNHAIVQGQCSYNTIFWHACLCTECHDQVEKDLIEEFEDAHHQGSISRMRSCAETLLPFKVKCFDMFVMNGLDFPIVMAPTCLATLE